MGQIKKSDVENFLKGEFLMQLATVSGDNIPHVSVLMYFVDDDLNFYFATHSDSQKATNLQGNPFVSIVIWKLGEMLVQVSAKAEKIVGDQVDYVFDKLGQAASHDEHFWPPLLRIKGAEYVVYKLVPQRMSALDLKSDNIRESSQPFSEIKL